MDQDGYTIIHLDNDGYGIIALSKFIQCQEWTLR